MARKFRFTVEGRYPFPVDMLRYDGAYPYGPSDVENMTSAIKGVTRGTDTLRPTVQIRLVSDRTPTIDRWTSFGWFVLGDRIERF
jgi:hypothetical protein